jgi:hypothetical protein
MRWNPPSARCVQANRRKAEMFSRRNSVMLDKVTMINLVWTSMIAVMLTATVTLYQDRSNTTEINYPQLTGRYHDVSYY